MFFYNRDNIQGLELSLVDTYSNADLERILHFLDGLMNSPEITVVFKVSHPFKAHFQNIIEQQNYHPEYTYNIIEKIA